METITRPSAAWLHALSDPIRLEVVQALSAGPRRAGELAERFDRSPAAMSKHLRILLEAGIVTDRRDTADARVRHFELRVEPIRSLAAWLNSLQAEWDARLGAFKRHVETL